ncbi:hypothetical protein STAS_14889, partial [Striga asiatica]
RRKLTAERGKEEKDAKDQVSQPSPYHLSPCSCFLIYKIVIQIKPDKCIHNLTTTLSNTGFSTLSSKKRKAPVVSSTPNVEILNDNTSESNYNACSDFLKSTPSLNIAPSIWIIMIATFSSSLTSLIMVKAIC